MTIDRLLSLWTDAAKAQGITSVRELVVDDRVFDRGTYHADWPVDQLHEGYCAEVAGLNFHLNRLDFWGTPSPRGAEVTRTEPACRFVSIRNDTKPGKTREDGLWIQREVDANNFTIHGFLRQPLQAPVGVTVDNPSAFFANLLAERLHDAGVQVGAVRLAEMTEPSFTGTDVGPVIRTPLRSAITRCNVDSQNLYAECLLKRIGHAASGAPGSWNNGTEAMQRQVVSRVGHAAGLQPVDGSGLSRNNRVTTSLLTAWVNDLLHDPALSETFLNSLAVGGKSGTVQKRFRDLDARLASVHCKTGYIDGVCSLSGVVQCTNGQQPTFSVICNDFESGGVSRARQLQEAVVKAIAQSYGRLPARQAPAEHPAMGGS
jgi:D-alanyl-D-alanine carboxypeptidase/D-alanyl-D-alanine-endopeptidase (penicillin-binding protein 4)